MTGSTSSGVAVGCSTTSAGASSARTAVLLYPAISAAISSASLCPSTTTSFVTSLMLLIPQKKNRPKAAVRSRETLVCGPLVFSSWLCHGEELLNFRYLRTKLYRFIMAAVGFKPAARLGDAILVVRLQLLPQRSGNLMLGELHCAYAWPGSARPAGSVGGLATCGD